MPSLLATPLPYGHHLKLDWLLSSGAGPISVDFNLTSTSTNGNNTSISAKSSNMNIQILIEEQAQIDGQGYGPVTFQLQQLPSGDLMISIVLPPFKSSLNLDPSVAVLLPSGGSGIPILEIVLPIALGVPFIMVVLTAAVAIPILVKKAMTRRRRLQTMKDHANLL
jgi:hypothetical protein